MYNNNHYHHIYIETYPYTTWLYLIIYQSITEMLPTGNKHPLPSAKTAIN